MKRNSLNSFNRVIAGLTRNRTRCRIRSGMTRVSAWTITAILSLLAVSCAKETFVNAPENEQQYFTFNATLASPSTKTYLDEVQVKWELGDKLSLWYGTLGTEMTQSDYFVGAVGSDARNATLNGFAQESSDYMAVYPRSAAKDCSKKGKLTLELPMKQNLATDSFASEANVSVAYSTTTDLHFLNIGGLLALRVSSTGGHTIEKIRLAGDAAMSGEVEIKEATIEAGNPAVDAMNESINFITLDCGDGIVDPGGYITEPYKEDNGDWSTNDDPEGDTTEPYGEENGSWGAATKSMTKTNASTKGTVYSGLGTYYMVVLPGTHTSFVLTFEDSDGKTAVLKSSHSFTIDRNSNTLIADVTLSDSDFKKDDEIYINEIFCHEDKVELYNPNDYEVDLSGYYFTKDDEKYWAIPCGTTIPAKGYKVFTAGQDDCTLGPTWGISGDKGFELKLSNGKKVDKIDNTGESLVVIGETETYGRRTDGADDWVLFSTGTIYEDGVCDGDNSKGTVKDKSASVVLNEINGNKGAKYIELYNPTDAAVSLEGWTLSKNGSVIWTGSNEVSIAANDYLVLYGGIETTPLSPTQFSAGISPKKSIQIILKDASATVKDTYTRGENFDNVTLPENTSASFSRVPNGTGDWKYASPTCGSANGEKTGTIEQYPAANGALVLNELDGNNKFIELYNTSTDYSISLEDVTIYKNDDATPIWTGAQGYSIAPGCWVLLYSEDVKSSHTGHDSGLFFSSGLSPKKTLKIEMKNAPASGDPTTLDTFTRGASPWGTTITSCSNSFGRTPDGTGSWYLMETSTPGAANSASKGDIPQN